MLILSRKESEQVCLGNDIVLTIVRVSNDKVRVGVTAPHNVKVLRGELQNQSFEICIHNPEKPSSDEGKLVQDKRDSGRRAA